MIHSFLSTTNFFLHIKTKTNKRTVANIVIKTSLSNHVLNGRGLITALSHKIQKILNMFDHIIFQIAISDFLFIAATIDVANSGREVHTATIVSQITVSLIPNIFAICIAQFTIHCHHKVNPTNHKTINKIDFQIGIFLTSTSSTRSFSDFDIQKI